VVPEDHAPLHFIFLRSTPSIPFSTNNKLMPPTPGFPVRHATVKKSAKMPLVIHFFSPFLGFVPEGGAEKAYIPP